MDIDLLCGTHVQNGKIYGQSWIPLQTCMLEVSCRENLVATYNDKFLFQFRKKIKHFVHVKLYRAHTYGEIMILFQVVVKETSICVVCDSKNRHMFVIWT